MSTIIYQVHSYSGESYSVEWGNFEDTIEGSYFKKSDAQMLVNNLEQQAKIEKAKYEKCHNCPSHELCFTGKNIEVIKQYCNEFEPSKDKTDDDYCVNAIMGLNETPTYEIKEVEVN